MRRETTPEGLTEKELETAVTVLSAVNEFHSSENRPGIASTLNEAKYLIEQYEEGASWTAEWDMPDVGDILVDEQSEFGDGRVKVTDTTQHSAKLTYIETETGKQSVAYKNPQYPANAPVVYAEYVEWSSKEYAFPRPRLVSPE